MTTALPRDPLRRFLEIAAELRATRGWFEDWAILRLAAIPLASASGEPAVVARRLRENAAELKRLTRWWESAHSSVRIFVAGSLAQHDTSPREFVEELRRVSALFRALGMKRGGPAEVLAILVLREAAEGGRVDDDRVRRMRDLYQRVRQDHTWILGCGEYPTLALLALTDDAPDAIGARVEAIFRDLRARGFRDRGALLPIPHILYFHPEPDRRACERFEALWNEFKGRRLSMHRGDYDEVALLAFLPGGASLVADRVLAHRAQIAALRPRPGRDPAFSLACATAFLELARDLPRMRRLSLVQAAYQVRYVLAARQAAAAAAAS